MKIKKTSGVFALTISIMITLLLLGAGEVLFAENSKLSTVVFYVE